MAAITRRSKKLLPYERIIVAADFKPPEGIHDPHTWVWSAFLELERKLERTGVCLKLNSALRLLGYQIIEEIHSPVGTPVFADLKLNDIGETLENDARMLSAYKPEFVTVMCSTGIEAMRRLKFMLPDTEVLGVTVLTTLGEDECRRIYGHSIKDAVLNFADMADEAGIDGLVCSPAETEMLRRNFGSRFTLATPGVRFEGKKVAGDDQNQKRVMTPRRALEAGADHIVIGRPVTQAPDPCGVVEEIIESIASFEPNTVEA